MIAEIKCYFGVSIDFCKELMKSQDCETVVRIYMPARTRQMNPGEESINNLWKIIYYYFRYLLNAGYRPYDIGRVKKLLKKYA